MVTTKNAAQRKATKKGVTKRKSTRKSSTRRRITRRLFSRIARARLGKKYRQGGMLLGEKSLNWPFDSDATPTRSAERQKIVEEYARQLLPPATYNVLKAQGVRWFPSDAERVRKHISSTGRDRALEFIASMYVVDTAHALLEELFVEVEDIGTKGALGDEERKRINGIITNITNKRVDPPAVGPIDVRAGAGVPLRIDGAEFIGNVPGGRNAQDSEYNVLYPISYTAKNGRVALADDFMLFRLVKSISSGKIRPADYSISTQLKVYSRLFPSPILPLTAVPRNNDQRINPAGPSMRSMLVEAEKLDEAAARDTEVSEPTALGRDVDVAEIRLVVDEIKMPLKDGFFGGMTIQAREIHELRAGMMRLLQLCKELSYLDTGFGGNSLNDEGIDLVPVGICPRGKVPAFFDANKRPISAWEDGNGFIRAPGYKSIECIPARSKAVGMRSSTNMPTAATAAQRGVQSAVSLRQVEALPKKELAKFVQRVVNMA